MACIFHFPFKSSYIIFDRDFSFNNLLFKSDITLRSLLGVTLRESMILKETNFQLNVKRIVITFFFLVFSLLLLFLVSVAAQPSIWAKAGYTPGLVASSSRWPIEHLDGV